MSNLTTTNRSSITKQMAPRDKLDVLADAMPLEVADADDILSPRGRPLNPTPAQLMRYELEMVRTVPESWSDFSGLSTETWYFLMGAARYLGFMDLKQARQRGAIVDVLSTALEAAETLGLWSLCPSCDSPDPKLHPSERCADSWHGQVTP